ncbi:MAG: signal peptidase I [Chloroflexi bacterium]|nr:signal peptidase I [Chloroflexota bacterium]
MKAFFREIVITAALAVAIFVLVQGTVQTFVVIGQSMQPNFETGQRLIVNKAVYAFREPVRGEVVVFEPPNNGRQEDYIKRVIGLPGDTIEIKKGKVYINDAPVNEPYIASPPDYTVARLKIPEDSYFVLGDNRGNSNDSHNGWVVPRQNLVGKVWISIWPPGRWGIIPGFPLQEQLADAASISLTGVNYQQR